MQYLQYWQLRQPPFDLTADPGFFFESRGHGEALARLLYLIADQSMGIGVFTGEIGTGKSMLMQVLRNRIPPDRYVMVYIPTAAFSYDDLMRETLRQLGVSVAEGGTYDLTRRLEVFLRQRIRAAGQHMLIVLDEAQLIEPDALERLKCLTNSPTAEPPPLTIVLSGQPGLRQVLTALPQVMQRVGILYHLPNLDREEVLAYVSHRLRAAGAQSDELFAPACEGPLFEFSRGCPRQINRVCKLAVDRACLMQRERVDTDLVDAIITDIREQFGQADHHVR